MGLQDFGFRVYEGERTSVLTRIIQLSWLEVTRAFRSKKFLIFFIFCILPALLQFVLVFLEFVVFEGNKNQRIVVDRMQATLTHKDVLKTYNIKEDRSPGLR